ncbi:hypothetical protein GGI11_005342 [Coemansia sp. RSA 2049]|nr:hypothetical protein GGI11_005342 [Coemansia sp. RSA 2049]
MVLLPSSSRKRTPPTPTTATPPAICVPDEGATPVSSKPPSPLGLEDGRPGIVGRRHRSRGGLELGAVEGRDLLASASASSSTTVLELGARRESSDSDTIGSDTSEAGTPVERLIHAAATKLAAAAEGGGGGGGSATASGGRRACDAHHVSPPPPPALALWMARAARDASSDRSRWMRAWMVDARVVAVLGGGAMVAPAVGYVILEKLVADDLEFHSPVLMLALVHGMAALLVELLTNRPFGVFVRAPAPMRVAPLLPLVAVYCAAVMAAQAAQRINSIHGTFQTTQCALPLAVAALLAALRTGGGSSGSANGARNPTVCGRLRRLVAQVARAPATDAAPGAGKTAAANSGSGNSSGRWVALPLAVALGISVWAPAYRTIIATETVGGAPTLGAQPTGAVLAYALESAALSAASLALHALFLVGASEFMSRRPGLSAAAFLRHFAPLAMLALLVLWPAAERPLYVLQTLDARALASCAGVACLGALALVARTAMLGASASDGVFGVAVVMQIKPLVCLAIGWWVYGYAYSARQPVAFFGALALVALWIGQRLVFSAPPRSPLLSLHHYYKPSP